MGRLPRAVFRTGGPMFWFEMVAIRPFGRKPRGLTVAQVLLQGREALVPLGPQCRHPRHRCTHGRGSEAVATLATGAFGVDEAGVSEGREMFDHRLTAHRQSVGEF